MNKYILFGVISLCVAVSAFWVHNHSVLADINAANINYPVQELGGCADQSSCKDYCNEADHVNACLDFAKNQGLMDDQEISYARKFMAAGAEGPGGCTDKDSCEAYCNDMSHINECVFFAEKNDLLPPQELAEAKKVQAALARGINPPACKNKKDCDNYCRSADHMAECVAFAEAAGFIEGKELDDAKKILAAVKRGLKMPCENKDTCREYCSQPEHMESCMEFALEAGLMEEGEREHSQKMLQAIRNGAVPPRCHGEEECKSYCATVEHIQECVAFAKAAGLIDEQQAEMAGKTGGRGPSGCTSKEECETFCAREENRQTCADFSREHNLMRGPETPGRPSQESMGGPSRQMPQAVLDCMAGEVASDVLENIKNGGMPSQEASAKLRACFEKFGHEQRNNDVNRPAEPRNFEGIDGQMRPGSDEKMMLPPPENFQERSPQEPFQEPPTFSPVPAESPAPASFLNSLLRYLTSALSSVLIMY